MRRICALAAFSLVVLACAQGEELSIVENICTSKADCDVYTQSGTQCEASRCVSTNTTLAAELLYSITVGLSNELSPGLTYTGKRATTFRCQSGAKDCFAIPTAVVRETYVLTASNASVLGLVVPPGRSVTIPARAEYRQLFDASLQQPLFDLGIDHPSVTSLSEAVDRRQTSVEETVVGPQDLPPLLWQGVLSLGTYERSIYPEPPYDAFVPPSVRTLSVDGFRESVRYIECLPDNLDTRTFTIRGVDRELDGWTAAIFDTRTNRRISVRKTLGAGINTVVLATSERTTLRGNLSRTELRIDPPRSIDYPSRIVESTGDFLPTVTTHEVPALKQQVAVGGSVRDPRGDLVPATLLIRANRIDTEPASNVLLRYERRVRSDGTFREDLWPGEYSVFVFPDTTDSDGSGFNGVASGVLTVLPGVPVQEGKSFSVPNKLRVVGNIALRDRRPFSDAMVEFRPVISSELSDQGLPTPRRSVGVVKGGTFYANVDKGTYDVFVRPIESSGYPWVVRVGQVIEGDMTLPDFFIPAPVVEKLSLRNASSGGRIDPPVSIRTYLLPRGRTDWVEIGRTTSDYSRLSSAVQSQNIQVLLNPFGLEE